MSRADLSMLTAAVGADSDAEAGWSHKAIPPAWHGRRFGDLAGSVPLAELSWPAMTLDRSAMDHNLEVFASWCDRHQVSLAPHGKTTMAPALFADQLRAGSWAITVANEAQLRVAHAVGVPRVIVANELLRPAGLAWLAQALDSDPDFDFLCWVDSVAGVEQMQAALAAAKGARPIPVAVELGAEGMRTGCRTPDEARAVAEAVLHSDRLQLSGTACYEGVLTHGSEAKDLAVVDHFLQQVSQFHLSLSGAYETEEPILTAGGSIWFDRVAEIFGQNADGARVVVRSGAYIVHDDGFYRSSTPYVRRQSGPQLRPAMHVWAQVVSIPDPDVAYLNAGKRDLPFDEGLPVGQAVLRDQELISLSDHPVVGLNDQHAHLRLPSGSPVRVGDVVRLGLSHPCTAFDKWQLIPVVADAADPRTTVTGFVRTYF